MSRWTSNGRAPTRGFTRYGRGCLGALAIAASLAACSGDDVAPVTEVAASAPLVLSVEGEGELRSAKATPLKVPGTNWAQRQLVWMKPEGSFVRKDEVIARFVSDQGKQDLAQALLDLQRNALARAAKEAELDSGQGRVAVDLSQVGTELGIAQRYADADLSTLARNTVLDAVQDVHFLGAKRDTLEWKRGQFAQRGGAELAVLDAQRNTYDLNAKTKQADLDALELRAPNDGVLMLTADWSGEKPIVGANMNAGREYGSLPDAAAMEVEVSLPELEAQGVQVGNAVELHPVGRPGQAIRSSLSWVASAAKVRSRESPVKYLSMRAPIPAEAIREYGLVPGQRLRARIVLLDAKQSFSVANIAVRGDDGRSFVEVRNGRGFEKREVKLGVRGTARSQVLEGLRDGDEVLLSRGTGPDEAAGEAAETTAGESGTESTGA